MTPLSDRAVVRLREGLAVPALPARYQPIEVIGRGGMGVVWRARDGELDRDVAVKVLAEHVAAESVATRLRREARILARLEHPGIVAVHDAGVLDDGRPWYVMRLVRGERLDAAGRRFAALGEVLRVMMRLAETVAFAHGRGIVHRDLKPANVMVGPFGEVLVLDWGVAGLAGPIGAAGDDRQGVAADGVTGHGAVLGTPGYMAPEQAAGLPSDHRSDVHGLGAILRDLLAARPGRVPAPLASIRDRAMAADPAARYDSALAFRDDLARFQDGLAVTAHRETVPERIARFVTRYRTPILLVAAYLVMRLVVLFWRGI